MIALLLRARDARHVAVYTIHEPPNPAMDRMERAESLEFVRDGFTWSVAAFPPLFLAAHKMWPELIVYVAAAVTGVCGLLAIGFNPALVLVLLAAGHIWLAYEAVDLQRNTLARRGWKMLGSVSGRNYAECERRFFDHWLGGETVADTGNSTGAEDNRSAAMTGLDHWLASLTSRFSRTSKT